MNSTALSPRWTRPSLSRTPFPTRMIPFATAALSCQWTTISLLTKSCPTTLLEGSLELVMVISAFSGFTRPFTSITSPASSISSAGPSLGFVGRNFDSGSTGFGGSVGFKGGTGLNGIATFRGVSSFGNGIVSQKRHGPTDSQIPNKHGKF